MEKRTVYTLRRATEGDIPALLQIFEAAKEKMHAGGNPQWPGNYPGAALLGQDMAEGESWLLAANGKPVATLALLTAPEPTYANIYNGAWPGGDIPYATIHRVAVDPAAQGAGLAGRLFAGVEARCRELGLASIRVDTHRLNTAMQGLLAKRGFAGCGIIYLADGDERLAFEKLL